MYFDLGAIYVRLTCLTTWLVYQFKGEYIVYPLSKTVIVPIGHNP